MLKIRIIPSKDVEQNMRRQMYYFDERITELERVIQQLGSLSGMDGAQAALRREKGRLEESRRTLDRMIKCLEKTILSYNSCENRICDNAQQEAVIYRRRIIGLSDLGTVSAMLRAVS